MYILLQHRLLQRLRIMFFENLSKRVIADKEKKELKTHLIEVLLQPPFLEHYKFVEILYFKKFEFNVCFTLYLALYLVGR